MYKLLVLSGDTLLQEINFTKENPSFVFFIINEKIYYVDTTIGKLWVTDIKTLDNLGNGHKRVIRNAVKRRGA